MNKLSQYLIEGISGDIIAYLMEDNNMDMTEEIALFYNSQLLKSLLMKQPVYTLRVRHMYMKY